MIDLMQRIQEKPVMIASGTFGWDGFGRGFKLDTSPLGAIVMKTITMEPLAGNPEPRWYPPQWGGPPFLNSVGLPNPGWKKPSAPISRRGASTDAPWSCRSWGASKWTGP